MKVEIREYSKKINGENILDNINIEFESGKIYGIKGKNGSGKTMLLRGICGLIKPTYGNVIIDDKIIGKDISFPDSIGALIENPGFISNYNGYKNLKLLADIKGKISKNDILQMLNKVGLESSSKKKFSKYSLGMKQKLAIAAAFMESPDLIILDEPTNALDTNSVEMLYKLFKEHKERGALIIFTCHNDEEIFKLSDQVYCIENGKITDCIIGEKSI